MQNNHHRVQIHRSLAVALAAALAITPAIAPRLAHADESTAELQSKLEAAQAQLDSLQRNLDQAEAELGKTSYDLDQTQARISEVTGQIEQNKKDLAEAQSSLSEHISSSYKNDTGNSLLSLVLNSENFDKLVANLFYANKIAKDEAAEIKKVQDLQAELEANQKELKDKEAEQQVLVASKSDEAQRARNAESDMAAYVNQLSDDVKQALAAERARIAEESRKAAEAALAAEQAQQQPNGSDNSPSSSSNSSNGGESSNSSGNGGGSSSNDGGGSSSNDNGSSDDWGGGGSSSATSDQRSIAVNAALAQVGKPYGHDNDGSNWDCNGLTNYAWGQAGVGIPLTSGHYSYGQFQWMRSSGRWVSSVSQLQPGDLVFYSYDGGNTTYHVAMYIGGSQVVHAEGYSVGVTVRSIDWCYGFCGGGSPI